MKQTLIITGSAGLLGSYLCDYFAPRFNVIGFYRHQRPKSPQITPVQIDLTDRAFVKDTFAKHRPQFVINAAGLASVDGCEENPQLAYRLNVEIVDNIANAIHPAETRFVHISTDHLFSGTDSNYSERSEVAAINVYARSKALAENILRGHENSVCVRTNFYGGASDEKKSFSNWTHDELRLGHSLTLFDDIFFTPISVCSLAENLELLMHSQLQGIYNISGTERISKYDFALKLAAIFNLNAEIIIRSQINDRHLRAPRPHDMSLSTEKIQSDLKNFVREDVNAGLLKIKAQKLI